MAVLNAFQIAKRAREQASTENLVTIAQARKRAVDAAKKRQRVVLVVDVSGRAIPFERKGECFVIEGSLSGQQSAAKRAAMRQARI